MMMLFFLIAGTAGAGGGLDYIGPSEYGEVYELHSGCLGSPQRITVELPERYDPASGYPVLVVLDGDEYFEMVLATTRALAGSGGMPDVIVIGLETDDPMSVYTPTNASVPDGTPLPSSGGGPGYLEFIERELLPAIGRGFAAEPCTVLFGHSMAGLFTVYAMIEGGGSIRGFIASSPSLWWDGELMTSTLTGWNGGGDGSCSRLYLSMGGEGETMLPPAERFAAAASENPGVEVLFLQFPGTGHQFVPFKSFACGIEYIFAPWRIDSPPEGLLLEDILLHFDSLSVIYGYDVPVPESMLNSAGYSALGRGDIAGALDAFRLNVLNHPGSANVYDSLGEALLESGDTAGAVENYRRSLELDPENRNAAEVLERLGL